MLQVCSLLLTVYQTYVFCLRAVACQKSTGLAACLTRQLRTGSIGCWEGGGSLLSESTKLENAAAVQGSTGKAVGSNEPQGWKQEA